MMMTSLSRVHDHHFFGMTLEWICNIVSKLLFNIDNQDVARGITVY